MCERDVEARSSFASSFRNCHGSALRENGELAGTFAIKRSRCSGTDAHRRFYGSPKIYSNHISLEIWESQYTGCLRIWTGLSNA